MTNETVVYYWRSEVTHNVYYLEVDYTGKRYSYGHLNRMNRRVWHTDLLHRLERKKHVLVIERSLFEKGFTHTSHLYGDY